jgi:hypothetical protein|tara:strand:- start:1482 stop:3257 length:1776 start_codon:yes stop_codon:yes gene_type:complete
MWYEIAVGSPRNRGLLTDLTALNLKAERKGSKVPVYRSTYYYNDEGREFALKHNSIKGYLGWRGIDILPLDVDYTTGHNETLQKALHIYDCLLTATIPKKYINIYYSGTGYHFEMAASLFEFPEGPDLPWIVKNTLKRISPDIDLSIYSRSALYRMHNTKNFKSGLFKIQLSRQDFQGFTSKEIRELARTRNAWSNNHLPTKGEMKGIVVKEVPSVRSLERVREPDKVVPCVQEMYALGPQEGSRHDTMMRIASHFRRNGIPSDATKAAILSWNNNSMAEATVLGNIEDVYNAGYQYGCHDEIMAAHCKKDCIYFKRKDYLMNVYNSDELQDLLMQRLNTNFEGRAIDLSHMFGLGQVDSLVYPGELMTIYGQTGANKTALAQNIALAYNSATDSINEDKQIKTLYLSLELSAWMMQRRNLQIVSNCNKEEVLTNPNELYKKYRKLLDHITIQVISPSIEGIQAKIREIQPACVIVDYIDLIEPPPGVRGEYETIKFISHSLSKIAVTNDIIVIQISQISREYSRGDIIDLFAGKGSGAIENASRKVLGIGGKANNQYKKVEALKNSDGDLWEVELEFQESFRLRRQDYGN